MMIKVKKPLSSYTILFFITIFISILSYFIPSGQFNYKNSTTGQVFIGQPTQIQIVQDKLVPILESYHQIENKTASIEDVFMAPIVGALKIIDFALLILVLGIFLEMLKSLKTFEMLVTLIMKYRLKSSTTSLLCLFVVSILSSITGLRDENIIFMSLLAPLFNYFGLGLLASGFIVLFGTVVGISSSLLNPTIIGIFSSLSGFPIPTGIFIRVIIFIVLYIVSAFILLKTFKESTEPSLTHEIPENHIKISFRYGLSSIALLFAFGTFIYCLLTGFSLTQTQGYLLGLTIIAGIIGGMKEYEIVNTIKKGAQELLPIAINICVARGVLYIMEKTEIKDTLLFVGSQFLGPEIPLVLFSFLFIALIFCFFLLINSTSAIASLVFPLMYPLLLSHNISYSMFILWFLIATSLSQIVNPTGFLLAQIRSETSLLYTDWLKKVFPLTLVLVLIWILSLFFI